MAKAWEALRAWEEKGLKCRYNSEDPFKPFAEWDIYPALNSDWEIEPEALWSLNFISPAFVFKKVTNPESFGLYDYEFRVIFECENPNFDLQIPRSLKKLKITFEEIPE